MQTNLPALIPVHVAAIEPPLDAVQLSDGCRGATVRSLCQPLDIAPNMQIVRIRRNPKLAQALVTMLVNTPGGPQRADVLVSWAIPIWAAGLNISRLPEAKQRVALILQQEAFVAIERAFTEPQDTTSAQPPPSQSPAPQSLWQEWHALIDRTAAEYGELRQEVHAEGEAIRHEFQIEHQEVRDQLAKVEQKLRGELLLLRQQQAAHPLRSAALEAGEVRSTLGSFAERLVQINLLASRARQRYGYPIAMTLAGLAEHFQVADVFDLPDKDWPAVLDWFTALLEE